jgi:Ca2+-binding RTX toxin-like protein
MGFNADQDFLQSMDVLDFPNTRSLTDSLSGSQPNVRLLLRPEILIEGTNAAETLQGEKGKTNSLSGLGGNDLLLGMDQGDTLGGGSGNDLLEGGGSGDFLYGNGGQDVLKGGTGQDYLQGDRGNDRLTGGAGSDEFAIQKGSGRDIITDYQDGQDKLAAFNVTFPALTIRQRGADTLIRSGSSTIAILENVTASTITANDFVVPLPIVS